jgi:hypothetical protein
MDFGTIKITTIHEPPPLGEGEWTVELSAAPVKLNLEQTRALANFLRVVANDPGAMHRPVSDPTFCETDKL